MTEIVIFIHAPRVVKKGEQGDDLDLGPGRGREPLAVFENPSPVDDAVVAADREP